MRKIKVIFLGLIFLWNCIFTTSCWNYREIDKLSIVAGAAIDRGPEGIYILTVEIVEFGGEKGTDTNSKVITLEGKTIFDAARNAIAYEGKRLYWSHAKVVIIGRDVAEENVVKVIDWFNRDSETRADIKLLVSKEKSAKEILASSGTTKGVRSFDIRDMIQNEKSLAKTPNIEVWRFSNDLIGKGVSAIAPAIELHNKNGEIGPHVMGTAIFKKHRLVGFISDEETKYILFIRNEIKGGILVQIRGKGEDRVPISLEIFNSKTKLKPVINGDSIQFDVNIESSVAIDEIGGVENYIEEKKREELEKAVGNALASKIEEVVGKIQSQYGSDIFGFGTKIRVDNPKEWSKVEENWEDKFKDIKVNVKVKINIRNSAMLSKPLEIGD